MTSAGPRLRSDHTIAACLAGMVLLLDCRPELRVLPVPAVLVDGLIGGV